MTSNIWVLKSIDSLERSNDVKTKITHLSDIWKKKHFDGEVKISRSVHSPPETPRAL